MAINMRRVDVEYALLPPLLLPLLPVAIRKEKKEEEDEVGRGNSGRRI